MARNPRTFKLGKKTKLKIEKTTSYQVEGKNGSYVATVYSRHDAVLVKNLAEQIPNVRGLEKGKAQPRGIYYYQGGFPIAESYDPRLARLIRQHGHEFHGES